MSQFCLRWNNHQPNFISVFTTLLNTESLVDVTLAAEGKHLQAHKVVLSACSVYFQTLFTQNPSRHPIVIIKDVSYADLRVLVDFMYYGEVNVTEDQLPRILDTARLLKIKGLTEMPDSSKHGSPPAEVTPERGMKDAEVGTSEWEQSVSSPVCRSPGAKRKRRKTSDETTVQAPDPPKDCVLSDLTQSEPPRNPIVSTLQQQNGLYQLPDIGGVYANVLQRTQDNEDSNLRTPQHPFGSHTSIEPNPYTHQGMPWVNPGYVHSTESFPDRQETNSTSFTHVNTNTNTPEYSNTGQVTNGQQELFTVVPVQDAQPPRQADTPNKRRRTSNPQAAENFQRAIEAVRFGGIGFCKAARIFGVNNRTLWLEYKKKGYPNTRPSIRERIKREPTEHPERTEASPAETSPNQHQNTPSPYVLTQNCFQYLQDSPLHSF